ncbi:hypothetical protein [Flavobacterium sp. CS20]|uniref:hypothetical protein n=1 Tax=Flavobacterium sp. CS20 TaxID=2775246 RepID=UPI001B3A067E|nr:hypothetical protein [Flavobacterium sp. CS20]QTY27911.1 hypothetical protein IGB25_05240 [Flavobacterium sp. CS20]
MENSKLKEKFLKEIEPKMNNFEIIHKDFKEGDFGSLEQIEFNSENIGGNIDFWSKGWLGIFLWDYKKEKEILNTLNEPNEEKDKKENFEKMKEIITTYI